MVLLAHQEDITVMEEVAATVELVIKPFSCTTVARDIHLMKTLFILKFFLIFILFGCEKGPKPSEDEVLNKYIDLFIRHKKTDIDKFDCNITKFTKSGIENGEVWDHVFWIVSCKYKSNPEGMTYYVDSDSYLLFQDRTGVD